MDQFLGGAPYDTAFDIIGKGIPPKTTMAEKDKVVPRDKDANTLNLENFQANVMKVLAEYKQKLHEFGRKIEEMNRREKQLIEGFEKSEAKDTFTIPTNLMTSKQIDQCIVLLFFLLAAIVFINYIS